MLKAIIANDKKKTNLMLRELINWNSLGIEVVGMAETGQEALELIIKNVPDIAVLNARLKDMSGPELVHQAQEQGVYPAYIVTMGTRSFESVYDALKCGVEEYLVGQINIGELEAGLKKICDRKLKEELEREQEIRERRAFEMNKNIIRKHFVSNLANSNVNDAVSTINQLNGEFLFNFRPGTFEVVIIKPDFQETNRYTPEDVDHILEEIGTLVEGQLGKRCMELVWYKHCGEVLCILNYSGDMHREYTILLERLKKLVRDKMDGFVTVALGSREPDPYSIANSMMAAKDALRARVLLGVDRVIAFGEMHYEAVPLSAVLTAERERTIKDYVEALNSKGISDIVEVMFNEIRAMSNASPNIYFNLASRMAEIVLNNLYQDSVTAENPVALKVEFDRDLMDRYSLIKIKSAVNRLCTIYIEGVLKEKDSQESKAVRVARLYIREHYTEQIKLADIAQLVHLNPSYFSTLFKKETGTNFNDFLIECRLEKAKEMLKKSDFTIAQISEKIGYNDSKHFSKLFVKNVGMKPSDYRKCYS